MANRKRLCRSISFSIMGWIFTFAGLVFIDKRLRRTRLYMGSVGDIASRGIGSWGFLRTPIPRGDRSSLPTRFHAPASKFPSPLNPENFTELASTSSLSRVCLGAVTVPVCYCVRQ